MKSEYSTDYDRFLREVVADLNEYEGENLWEDVARHIPGYDETATQELDPTYQSNVIALRDGTVLRHPESRGAWEVAERGTESRTPVGDRLGREARLVLDRMNGRTR
jgi:hypothetical protein